jgi:SAM-dependent methyltransferase
VTDLRELEWVETACPLCDVNEPITVAEVDRYDVTLRVVRCGTCRHVYLSPRPKEADLGRLYDEDYYTGESGYSYADDRMVPETAALRADARLARIEELRAPGRLLEVGCSFGAFLLAARKRGWKPKGLDVSPFAVTACRNAGLDVREGSLETAYFDPESFDAVYLAETVEHLVDPRGAIRSAVAAIAPGGLLVLATGNHDSVARVLRGRRWGYYMPGHLQYFSARSLSELMEDLGLEIVRRRFGDDRAIRALKRIRGLEGRRAGIRGMVSDLLRRLHVVGFSLGAGMVLYGRKPGEAP